MAFPVEVDENGLLGVAAAEPKIQQSLLLILGTSQGERVMSPDFGSRLQELLFEPNNTATRGRAVKLVTEAITKWEPRVDLVHVDVTPDPAVPSRLLIDIDYRVRPTNSRFNLVYPFYLRDGTNANTRT